MQTVANGGPAGWEALVLQVAQSRLERKRQQQLEALVRNRPLAEFRDYRQHALHSSLHARAGVLLHRPESHFVEGGGGHRPEPMNNGATMVACGIALEHRIVTHAFFRVTSTETRTAALGTG
jgi:hypothetical protein